MLKCENSSTVIDMHIIYQKVRSLNPLSPNFIELIKKKTLGCNNLDYIYRSEFVTI